MVCACPEYDLAVFADLADALNRFKIDILVRFPLLGHNDKIHYAPRSGQVPILGVQLQGKNQIQQNQIENPARE